MKHSFIAITVLLFLAFTSCEYEPKGLFDRHLNQNTKAPDIETVELDLSEDQDTIDLMYNRVYFNFKSSDQKIKLVNFYLDDSIVGTVKSGKGYYDFYGWPIYEGTHKLKMEILASSGTGSIADSLGAEGFVFTSKEWVVRMKQTEYSNVTTTAENGFLKLRWTTYLDKTFEYIVYRNDKEIGRTVKCEFIDSSYVGEGGNYYIKYQYEKNGPTAGLEYVRLPNEMDFTFKADASNNYTIDWSKFKYYAAIGSVSIYSSKGYYDYFKIQEVKNPEQMRATIPTSDFGLLKLYKIKFTPKYHNTVYDPSQTENSPFISARKFYMVGYHSPIFEDFLHLSKTEFLYHTSRYDYENTSYADTLFRYSISENKIKARTRYNPYNYQWSGDHYDNITVTPDGKNYLAHAGFTGTVIFGSSSDFKSYKIINVSDVNNGTRAIPVSNIGTGILQDGYKKYLYDFKNVKLLGTLDNAIAYDDMAISPNGNYFIFKGWSSFDLYSYSNNTITKVKSYYTGPTINYAHFFPGDPDKIVCWSKDSKKIDIISCPDLTVIKSFDVDENYILDIDYTSGRILSFSDNLLVVRSLEDGTIQYKIPVGFTYWDSHKCYLTGNSIFHELGARYFLN